MVCVWWCEGVKVMDEMLVDEEEEKDKEEEGRTCPKNVFTVLSDTAE
jgi:hypothetical protein